MLMKLLQSQVQRLSLHQLQSIEMLQLSTQELDAYIRELSLSNPLVEPDEVTPSSPEGRQEDDLLRKLKWLEDNDYQNRFYQRVDDDELDPLALLPSDGGLEETLFRFLSRQVHQLGLSESMAQIVRYLAACLDDNGYFRIPLEELSQNSSIPVSKLEEGLTILRRLEPAGVGAADLSQCLELQLHRIHETGPALSIVRCYLPLLAKRHYRDIAARLGITQEEVLQAERLIRELEPRPGAVFQQPEQIPYILPDVFVEEDKTGRLIARTRRRERPPFRINSYYRQLLSESQDKEVKEYLTDKLRQAEGVLSAIGQRESTLQRCAQVIVDRQAAFFRQGPQALLPLRMSDVAEELELHESTISRTVREKYLQCSKGVFPMSYFFSRAATAGGDAPSFGGTAARALLRRLIDGEDKSKPLSDQKLCELMAQEDCPISRRTVAKYREELNIPSAFARKTR